MDLSSSPTSSCSTSGVIPIRDYSYERGEGERRSESQHRTDHLTERGGQNSGREEEREGREEGQKSEEGEGVVNSVHQDTAFVNTGTDRTQMKMISMTTNNSLLLT